MASPLTDELSLTGRRWQQAQGPFIDLSEGQGIPGWVSHLLGSRGIAEGAVGPFLSPTLKALEDPACMQDMERAIARITQAREKKEKVVIYGDYDVDGVCATSVLRQFLLFCGCNVDFYIPDRRAEGYGVNGAAIEELARSYALMITVDCGITSVSEVELANSLGMDVIIVDHHQVGSALPPATACLNPHRSDCGYGFKYLAAAGVAFMLVVGLRRAWRDMGFFADKQPDLRPLLDLVALATVADMVPLVGANRVLVAAGLAQMRQTPRPGILALCHVARVDVARLSASDIAFRLGPRINARGRMRHAGLAVELMLAASLTEAAPMAQALDDANTSRRRVERATLEAAEKQGALTVHADAPALVVYEPSWHPGVLGLVASRLVQRYHRPAVVIGEGGKGSCRSIVGVDLVRALTACSAHLLRFGGHPAAAGLTIDPAAVPAFTEALRAAILQQIGGLPEVPAYRPDLEVHPRALGLPLLSTLERLEPFGLGNPEPLFVGRNLAVRDSRVVGQDHLKLRLTDARTDAMCFGLADLAPKLPPQIDALFHVERNVWQGRETLQLRVLDLRAHDALR